MQGMKPTALAVVVSAWVGGAAFLASLPVVGWLAWIGYGVSPPENVESTVLSIAAGIGAAASLTHAAIGIALKRASGHRLWRGIALWLTAAAMLLPLVLSLFTILLIGIGEANWLLLALECFFICIVAWGGQSAYRIAVGHRMNFSGSRPGVHDRRSGAVLAGGLDPFAKAPWKAEPGVGDLGGSGHSPEKKVSLKSNGGRPEPCKA